MLYIYTSRKPTKTVRLQKFLEELSDFSFSFEHVSGKNMFVSDFLSRFSSNTEENEPIPFVMDCSELNSKNFMTYLDDKCKYDCKTNSGMCTDHSFPVTRSHSKAQNIQMPSLFSNPSTKLKNRTDPSVRKVNISIVSAKASSKALPAEVAPTHRRRRPRQNIMPVQTPILVGDKPQSVPKHCQGVECKPTLPGYPNAQT